MSMIETKNSDGTISEVGLLNPLPVATMPYVAAATVQVSSTTGAAAAQNPVLGNLAGKTTYVAGFSITGAGATAASVISVTVQGTLLGNLNYKIAVPAGATVGITPLIVNFNPPIPANAANASIILNVPSFGAGNTDAAAVIWGFIV